MATYIKGVNSYLADIQPFTPDFKFLSAVLDTRQDRYDANFQATNDLYNKVVYADLSRQDTKNRRDQYAETIAPQLEQISGLDLSLQQNVDTAKGVFAPFFQDDLTVKDIVFTSRYRDEMNYANRLLDSPDRERSEKWWQTGIDKMNYEMQDFINASESKALNMALPRYVEDADLNELSQKILSEMDPPLKMKMDRFGMRPNPKFDPNKPISNENPKEIANTDFIITEQNGRLVTGAAMNILRNQLLDDPKVQQAYYADAFVKSRKFADAGMEAGQFSTIEQGQNAWATETISRINLINEANIQQQDQENEKLKDANVRWSNYAAVTGIVPGSDEEVAIEDQLSLQERTENALNDMLNIRQEANTPSKSVQGNLNKAYNMLMNFNISDDMRKAATDFASRDMIYEMRENKFALQEDAFKNSLALERARATNALNLEAFKQKNRKEILKLEKEGSISGLLGKFLNKGNTKFGDASTTSVAVDDMDENTDFVELSKKQFVREDNKLYARQVDGVLEALQVMDPNGNTTSQDQTYTIMNPDNPEEILYEGNIESLRRQMSQPIKDDETGQILSYKNREQVDKIFDAVSDRLRNTQEVTMNNPNVTLKEGQRERYDNIYNGFFGPNGIQEQRDGIEATMTRVNEVTKNNYEVMRATLTDESNIGTQAKNYRMLKEAGFPDLLDENGSIMSKKEYIDLVTKKVQAGEITNPDLYGFDWGTGNKDYLIDEVEYETYSGRDGQGGSELKIRERKTGRKVVDSSAVADDVLGIYDTMYALTNSAMRGEKGSLPSVTFDSVRFGAAETPADAISNPTYSYPINPLTGLSPEAEQEFINMLTQIEDFEEKGQVYGIVAGDLTGLDLEDLLTQDPVAVRAFELYKEDLNTYINDNRSGSSDKVAPIARLEYMPVYGPADEVNKTTAGYRLIFSPEWLASKKAGTEDAPVGAFTVAEIRQLQGLGEDEKAAGISIVFQQAQDQNRKSINNSYFSAVETRILNNPGKNYYEGSVPDGLVNSADYRVVKNGPGQYRINWTQYTYIPYDPSKEAGQTGIYLPEEYSEALDFNNGLRGIDNQLNAYIRAIEENVRNSNRRLVKKDKEQYGNKNLILDQVSNLLK